MILNFNAGTAVGMSPFLAKGLSQYKNPNHNYISGYQNNFNYFYRFWSQPRLGQVHYDEEDAHRCSPGKYPDHHWASIWDPGKNREHYPDNCKNYTHNKIDLSPFDGLFIPHKIISLESYFASILIIQRITCQSWSELSASSRCHTRIHEIPSFRSEQALRSRKNESCCLFIFWACRALPAMTHGNWGQSPISSVKMEPVSLIFPLFLSGRVEMKIQINLYISILKSLSISIKILLLSLIPVSLQF